MKGLLLFGLLSMSSLGYADPGFPYKWSYDRSYFDIADIKVTEQELTEEDLNSLPAQSDLKNERAALPPISSKDIKLDTILTVGKTIWKIVDSNRPVVTANVQRVSALPEGAIHWVQFERWHEPKVKKFSVVMKNKFNIEVVHFDYLLTYSYGGQHNGKGRYLSEVGFVISKLSVLWFYNFNVLSQVVRVNNVGTTENPIAGIELNLGWNVKNPLIDYTGTNNFYIQGDGSLRVE